MMGSRLEADLYEPVKTFLENLGYEVKGEVQSCDVVAVKPGSDEPVIVELKRQFGLPAVYQGIERSKLSDRIYLAVERKDDPQKGLSKKWKNAVTLCRMLGFGLMTVKFYRRKPPRVDILCEPGPYRPRQDRRGTGSLLREFRLRSGDYNTGGSTRTNLVTAYRETALECAYWLGREGALTAKELRERTEYAHVARLLSDNYYGWFERIGRGVYRITDQGRQALEAYRDVIERKFGG